MKYPASCFDRFFMFFTWELESGDFTDTTQQRAAPTQEMQMACITPSRRCCLPRLHGG